MFFSFSIIALFAFSGLEAEQSFSFLAGVLISEFYDVIIPKVENKYLTLSIIFFIIGTFFFGVKQIPYIRLYGNHAIFNIIQLFIKLPYALFFICAMHTHQTTILYNSKFLNLSGKISYELYLIHMIFLEYIGGKAYMVYSIVILSYFIAYGYFLVNTRITYMLKNI